MTAEQWIAEARQRIESCEETIAEADNVSSCDKRYWSTAQSQANSANSEIKFLKQGIKLLEGVK